MSGAVSALGETVMVAMDLWQRDGGEGDLLELLDDAIDALAEGVRSLDAGPESPAPT